MGYPFEEAADEMSDIDLNELRSALAEIAEAKDALKGMAADQHGPLPIALDHAEIIITRIAIEQILADGKRRVLAREMSPEEYARIVREIAEGRVPS